MARAPQTAEEIEPLLEHWLEAEFTRHPVEPLAIAIAALSPFEREFTLDWVRRTATVNLQVAHMVARHVPQMLVHTDTRTVEAWIMQAIDACDRDGLKAALEVLRDPQRFVRLGRERAAGAVFDDIAGILRNFVCGLAGRALRLEAGDAAWTDGETLYLPPVIAEMESAADNFTLGKATVTLLWAQTRFGTFRADIVERCARFDDPARAQAAFHALETMRLEACIARELPGLAREMERLRKVATPGGRPSGRTGEVAAPDRLAGCRDFAERLAAPDATVEDSLALLASAYARAELPRSPWAVELRPDKVAERTASRVAREKTLLKVRLNELLEAREQAPREEGAASPEIELQAPDVAVLELPRFELFIDGAPVPVPEDVRQLLTSIQLDLGEIPPDYLQPAGPGEYDPALIQPLAKDPDEVWQGTYHEEGATFFPEWDFGRSHYRKNWCVMREREVQPVADEFVVDVLRRYGGHARQLRRTFEAMRDSDRREKRQVEGDDIDFDALVETIAEHHAGQEWNDRVLTRLHRSERDIAALFLIDMSGSTQGWINEAERAALILLCEAFEALGDRYAIYGFSGMTRKKCEIFRIKRFDEPYDEAVKGRISGIRPQDYTRMGFAIRHATALLLEVEAKTRLMITLSDGKPDDYSDNYRGKYGIEDTRRALLEATRAGVRPFCITLDQEARDYLPHLYGNARYTVVDDVARLPYKVADIYRRLTV
jgi:nitric oxide reductase NorD protein